jgi:hypothetical protein
MRNCKNGHLHCGEREFYVLIRGITCHFSALSDRRVMPHSMLSGKRENRFFSVFQAREKREGTPEEVIHAFPPPSYYVPSKWEYCGIFKHGRLQDGSREILSVANA